MKPPSLQHRGGGRDPVAVAVGLLVALLVVVWSGTTGTLSAWPAGRVANDSNGAAGGSLVISHSAGSCSLGPRVTGSVACPGSLVGTDTITHGGTLPAARMASSVIATSCGPVSLANQAAAARPLLARGTIGFQASGPFGGTNAVTLSAAGSGYATAIQQQSEPVPPALTSATYGVGIWFKAASGASGPLMSFGTNPSATAGGESRTFALTSTGAVRFTGVGGLGGSVTTSSTYADGAWHFAYVRISLTAGSLLESVSLTVDDSTPVTGLLTLLTSSATGFWRLGWGPTSYTGAANPYFTGSLSNAVVFYGSANAPAPPTSAQRASQSAFTTWASAATEQWLLGDSGTTTYAGSEPVIGTTSPCALTDIAWTFTNPASTAAASGTKLSAFADNTPRTISPPAPGTSQTSTLTVTRDAGNSAGQNSYLSGLRLSVPLTYLVSAAGSAWPLTFRWQGADSALVVP